MEIHVARLEYGDRLILLSFELAVEVDLGRGAVFDYPIT